MSGLQSFAVTTAEGAYVVTFADASTQNFIASATSFRAFADSSPLFVMKTQDSDETVFDYTLMTAPAGATSAANAITLIQALAVAWSVGTLAVTEATASTSTTTGAAIVTGGMGIGGNLHLATNRLFIAGTLSGGWLGPITLNASSGLGAAPTLPTDDGTVSSTSFLRYMQHDDFVEITLIFAYTTGAGSSETTHAFVTDAGDLPMSTHTGLIRGGAGKDQSCVIQRGAVIVSPSICTFTQSAAPTTTSTFSFSGSFAATSTFDVALALSYPL